MTPALQTLIHALTGEGAPALPTRAIFLGAEPHPTLTKIPEMVGWQPFKPKAEAWEQAGFHRTDEPSGKWPMVLLLPGKSRTETLAGFARARDLIEMGGTLAIAMPNSAGASRFEKELARATGSVTSVSKNKCRAFFATESDSWDESVFDEWRNLAKPRQIPGTTFTVEPGIFSSDHIDPGSSLLADHLPSFLRGTAADLGAGWGFLTKSLIERCPQITNVDLYEADLRALRWARKNLTTCELPLQFHWHDVTAGLATSYDTIVMNPPFHSGQSTDLDLGRTFIKVAAASLSRSGRLLFVANRQLPYEATLELTGLAWRKVAEDSTFKVFLAERRSI